MKITNALIMAAGRGLRMMPLTSKIPKPMAPYLGSTLIAEGIGKLAGKIEKIHVTVGYKAAMLAQHVIEHGASSVFNTEGEPNNWWLYNTPLKHLDEPVFVLTCDNIVELDFERLANDYFALDSPVCMVVPVKPLDGLEGDYVFHRDGVVTAITREHPSDLYCSGIQVLNPKKINDITQEGDSFYSVWSQLIERRNLMVSRIYPEKWFAVDTVEQLSQINGIF